MCLTENLLQAFFHGMECKQFNEEVKNLVSFVKSDNLRGREEGRGKQEKLGMIYSLNDTFNEREN